MKRKMTALIMAIVMSLGLLAGCGSSQSENSTTATPPAEATTAGSGAITDGLATLNLPSGDMSALPELKPVEKFSDEDVQKVERAIRAYKPAFDETVLTNNAESFYYYEQLDGLSKDFYDAMIMVTEDPVSNDYYTKYTPDKKLTDDEVISAYYNAYIAMTNDHPEFFWLYNSSENYINIGTDNVTSALYFHMEKPFKDYEKQAKAFNKGVKEIMDGIDTNASDYEVAREIHDRICAIATYDNKLLEMGESEKAFTDLGHTAYGVFVENSRGDKHTAVCDGYSLAYEYLLQQCGIDASVVRGSAGPEKSKMGGHAWNVVSIDGDWYEVDSTWDDNMMELGDQIPKDTPGYNYYMEALGDKDYFEKIGHFLFCVTTKEISDYHPGSEYNYTTKDKKYTFSLVSPSVRVRAADEKGMEIEKDLSNLLPQATGTKY